MTATPALPAILLRWLAVLLAAQMSVACAITDGPAVSLQPLFADLTFTRPVAMLQTPGTGPDWYVVEKGGRVVRVEGEGSAALTALFVDISDRVDAAPSEAGLLGMAFHPDFADNGQVYLSYTRGAPLTSVLSRFVSRDGGLTLDAASEEVLLEVPQPYGNHNGGQIAFGPDGYLYFGLGDGGAGGDPHGNGQNTQTLLGAMLRLAVNGPSPYAIPPDNPFVGGGGRPEIYAWGLRNPWRWSFDRLGGELWVGDVGQNAWEEIDRVSLGDNLGWNLWEGSHCFTPGACRSEGVVMPVAEYSHALGCSVTGGYVYRGEAVPALYGRYLFGDFCSGTVWQLDSGNPQAGARILIESGLQLSSFAEDRNGELYLLDYGSGGIFRLVAE
jgi:glucose/arabinose dehydrogenase